MRKFAAYTFALVLALTLTPSSFAQQCVAGCREHIDFSECKFPGILYASCEDVINCDWIFDEYSQSYYYWCSSACQTTDCYEV
jgi:hypothetical protein